MSKLRLVRKEKVKENSVVGDAVEVRCGNPECGSKIKITNGFTLNKIDASMKVGPCANAVWICDACRAKKRLLKSVRTIANDHIFKEHMVRNFFPAM